MKRLGSSDSLGALITICPTTTTVDDERSPRNNHVYGREFQSMLEGLDEEELSGGGGRHQSEKKRRLSVDQVKALEKNFEVENKLEPDRKVKLAQELGLQPRQVAVWFQNRRARWKTKQLERDYGVLKANYDSLKLNFDSLQRDNQSLLKEVKELKSRLEEEEEEENSESYDVTVKEEMITVQEESTQPLTETAAIPESDSKDCFIGGDGMGAVSGSLLFAAAKDLKDGSSDSSDSSAILNEENITNNNNNNNSSSDDQNAAILMSPANCSSSMSCFQFQTQYHVKMEEHNFFSADEACNFFSDEQAPTLQQLYCSDEWN